MNNQRSEIIVSERIADNLVTRRAADELFDFIESAKQNTVTLNFTNVKFASRSFVHEYLINRKNAEKRIVEINMPTKVKKMFVVVRKQRDTPVHVNFSSFKSVPLAAKGV